MSSSFILNTSDRERLTAAYPGVFNRSFMQRYGLLVGLLAVTAYLIGCFFFFNVLSIFNISSKSVCLRFKVTNF